MRQTLERPILCKLLRVLRCFNRPHLLSAPLSIVKCSQKKSSAAAAGL
jgi:hypothetical protein